jgi:hypothetical protein
MFSVSVGQFHLFFLGVLDELVVKFHFKKTRSVGVKPSHGIPIKKKIFSRRLKKFIKYMSHPYTARHHRPMRMITP